MKRLKSIVLVCILSSAIGCQQANTDMVPIDNYAIEIIDESPVEVQIDQGTVTESEEETDVLLSNDDLSENEKINQMVSKTVQLSDEEEIESKEWVDDEKQCYRVRICYKEQREGEYKHKRDYFFYFDGDKIVSLEVDYPSTKDEDFDSDRYVAAACDFNAKLEDVTFDGKKDLVIFLGYQGSRGTMFSCAYIYTDTGFEYCKSFEGIPNYVIDIDNKQITGRNTNSAGSYSEMQYSYDSAKNEFTEINRTNYEWDEASGNYVVK